MSDPEAVRQRIAALSDDHAVTVLALVLKRRGDTVDPFTQTEQREHLREALAQPEIIDAVAPIPDTGGGDLARTALTHLVDTDPAAIDVVDRAVDIAPAADRDPATILLIGSLVLLAFQSEVELSRDPKKGWKLRFHKKGLSDSTVGKLLGQLLGNFLTPP